MPLLWKWNELHRTPFEIVARSFMLDPFKNKMKALANDASWMLCSILYGYCAPRSFLYHRRASLFTVVARINCTRAVSSCPISSCHPSFDLFILKRPWHFRSSTDVLWTNPLNPFLLWPRYWIRCVVLSSFVIVKLMFKLLKQW